MVQLVWGIPTASPLGWRIPTISALLGLMDHYNCYLYLNITCSSFLLISISLLTVSVIINTCSVHYNNCEICTKRLSLKTNLTAPSIIKLWPKILLLDRPLLPETIQLLDNMAKGSTIKGVYVSLNYDVVKFSTSIPLFNVQYQNMSVIRIYPYGSQVLKLTSISL